MKKNITKFLSIALVLATIFSINAIGLTASAANYTTNYSNYDAPENSGDYAYWNGSKVVRSGNTSKDEVMWMQAALNYCITNKGLSTSKLDVDGSFGPASKAATTAFQKKYGLSVDGSFGPSTISKMKSVLSTSATPSSKTLSINWNNINSTGYQSVSGPCGCYALAYCRDIIDGKSHSWTEYSYEGYVKSLGRYGYTASWGKANYVSKNSTSTSTVYKAMYDSLKSGKPVIVNVTGGRSTGSHYIAIVGYTNVSDTNSLSAKNFLIIDSAKKAKKTATENMSSVGYSLHKNGSSQYQYIVSK